METTSKSARVAVIAASVAVTCWAAKATAIGLAGGLGRSRLEDPLFLVGLAGLLVATACLGVALTAGRPLAVRILAGAAGPVLGFAGAALVNVLLSPIRPADPVWVWEEINLWVVGPLALLLALVVARRRA